jgi:quinol monooxygenase YgiN
MITITAIIRTKTNAAELEKINSLFSTLIEATRKEVGCHKYDLHEVIGQPGVFIMMEEWASESAIEEHNSSKHFTAFVESAKPYLSAQLEIFRSLKLF